MKRTDNVFTFSNEDSDDEYIDCNSDTDHRPDDVLSSSVIPAPFSVQQPPFFRTRDRKTPLYPSRCYAVPPSSAMRLSPVVVGFRKDGTEVLFQKDPSQAIRFVGVNAVSFDENDPATIFTPLSSEECARIFHKEEREAITIIEDEETLRNDSMLDFVDDMEDDTDVIPISRLRQFIRNDMGKVIPNRRISLTSDPPESPRDAIPSRPKPVPQFFTFNEVTEMEDNSAAETVSQDRKMGLFSSPHLEGISSVRDSLSDESSTPFRRLSIKELEIISSRQSVGSQKELRSPRLSSCQTPLSIAQTPRCCTGKIGAATVAKDGVSFFLSAGEEKEGHPTDSSLSREMKRRISLTRQVDSIRRFCKEKMESLKVFQKRLQRVLDTELPVMEKNDVIKDIQSVLTSIDNAQYRIRTELADSIAVESEYHLLRMGYAKTERWLMTMKKDTLTDYFTELRMYGLKVLDMQDNALQVRLECENDCSLDFQVRTTNYSTVLASLSVNTNGSKLFEGIALNSGLYSVFRKEVHFHELHEYFHIIWFFCMRVKAEYRRRLRG